MSILDLVKQCTLSANDAVAYSVRPKFQAAVTGFGGFFVRIAVTQPNISNTPLGGDDEKQQQTQNINVVRYKIGRIKHVHTLAERGAVYKARGLMCDSLLEIDSLPPGKPVPLTSISNTPILLHEFEDYCNELVEVVGGVGGKLEKRCPEFLLPLVPPPSSSPLTPSLVNANTNNALQICAVNLQKCWRDNLINHVLSDRTEAELLVERNEKLSRYRHNLASDLNFHSQQLQSSLEKAEEARQVALLAQEQFLQSQQEQQEQRDSQQSSSFEGGEESPKFNTQALIISGGGGDFGGDSQRLNEQNQQQELFLREKIEAAERERDQIERELEEYERANEQFTSFVRNHQRKEALLVRLTAANRAKNDLIALRGEKLRLAYDQRVGTPAEMENIWELDPGERVRLAKMFDPDKAKDKKKDEKKGMERNLLKEQEEKAERIAQLATIQSQRRSSANEISQALQRFSSAQVLDRLAKDAAAAAASSTSRNAKQQQSKKNISSSSMSIFSLPLRRTRVEETTQQQQQSTTENEQQEEETNNSSNINHHNMGIAGAASSSSLMMAPQNTREDL